MSRFQSLSDVYVLVVEDDYFMAFDIAKSLMRAGAQVVGPASNISEAGRLVASTAHIDVAVLDLDLNGQLAFAIVDQLVDQSVPVILSTGYDPTFLPAVYRNCPIFTKPHPPSLKVNAIEREIGGSRPI